MQVIKSGEGEHNDAAAAAGESKSADTDRSTSLGATSTPSRSKVSLLPIEPLNSLPVHLLSPLILKRVSITVHNQSVP